MPPDAYSHYKLKQWFSSESPNFLNNSWGSIFSLFGGTMHYGKVVLNVPIIFYYKQHGGAEGINWKYIDTNW